MTPADFRKLALSLEGAAEGAHGGHADFRAGSKVFASLGYPGATSVRLSAADARTMLSALTMAWQTVTTARRPKKPR